MITPEEYCYFADRALDGMAAIVAGLGDELSTRRPALPGANTPYGLLTHCLAVVETWAGHLVHGRPLARDRDAEFTAVGPVAPLLARVAQVRAQLALDAATATPGAPLHTAPPASYEGPDRELTQGAALQHVYEELAQHHGQMEQIRDLILAEARGAEARGAEARGVGTNPADAAFDVDPARLRAGVGVKWGAADADVLPAWVADMDFPAPDVVLDRVADVVRRSDLGYPFWPGGDPVVLAFEDRMRARYGWAPEPGVTRVFTDVLQVLQVVVEHATEPGDGVAVLVPSYPPFLASVERAGRRIVPVPMVDDGTGWRFGTDGLAARLADSGVRLLVLVNPHNPTGRVLTRGELQALADVAAQLDLVVLSDEIHADLTYAGHAHVPFASLGPEVAARTVTTTSATKAFNIAGMRCAVAHVGDARVRARLDALPIDVFGTPSTLGRVATVAAWREADDWLERLRDVLTANRATIVAWAADRQDVRLHAPEATYLAWLDLSGTALRADDPAADVLRLGRVQLSQGAEFAQHTDVDTRSFARLNFATSPARLADLLERVDRAIAAAG
jgi:cystathionine beta-lyase